MANYARIIGGFAVDVTTDPKNSFHPDLVTEFVKVPDNVTHGWRLADKTWSAPVEALPSPVSVEITHVTRTEFMRLFTGPERVAIKNARGTDDLVEDFFSMVEDPDSPGVDLTLQSTLNILLHLQSMEIITDARRLAILAGVPQ